MLNAVLGFLIEYVLLALDVAPLPEPPELVLLGIGVVHVVSAALLVGDDVEVAAGGLVVIVVSMPTQYEYFTQKFVMQSSETAGFHLRKSLCDIFESVSTV